MSFAKVQGKWVVVTDDNIQNKHLHGKGKNDSKRDNMKFPHNQCRFCLPGEIIYLFIFPERKQISIYIYMQPFYKDCIQIHAESMNSVELHVS